MQIFLLYMSWITIKLTLSKAAHFGGRAKAVSLPKTKLPRVLKKKKSSPGKYHSPDLLFRETERKQK